jgi:hypothetical protein
MEVTTMPTNTTPPITRDPEIHPARRRRLCHRDKARGHDDRGREDAMIICAEVGFLRAASRQAA